MEPAWFLRSHPEAGEYLPRTPFSRRFHPAQAGESLIGSPPPFYGVLVEFRVVAGDFVRGGHGLVKLLELSAVRAGPAGHPVVRVVGLGA